MSSWGSEGGLLALSVGGEIGVMAELMDEEVEDVGARRAKHDPTRSIVRHAMSPG